MTTTMIEQEVDEEEEWELLLRRTGHLQIELTLQLLFLDARKVQCSSHTGET